jgi:ribosomal protein S21
VKIVLEVKRKEGENFESLIRRFTKKTLQSGRIIQAKKVMFHQKPLSKRAQKERAKKREETRKLQEYLRRIGKLNELLEGKKMGKSFPRR